MPRTRAFVALGSNLGARRDNLRRAIAALAATEGVTLLERAKVRETEPLLPPGDSTPQPRYLNSAVLVETSLSPRALHRVLQRIERQLGRGKATRWAPRVIDLDLLLYGDAVLRTRALTVPHRELHRRRFVLEPLVDLDPTAWHPVLHKDVRALLAVVIRRP